MLDERWVPLCDTEEDFEGVGNGVLRGWTMGVLNNASNSSSATD